MSVTIVPGKGFQIAFKNGRTLSCMFGYGNYCENRSKREYLPAPEAEVPLHSSADFEIAGWSDRDCPWVNFGCDEVEGWVDLKHVVDFGKFLRDAENIHFFEVDYDRDPVQIRLSTNKYPDCVSVLNNDGSWTPLFWGDSEAEYALGMLELCLERIHGEKPMSNTEALIARFPHLADEYQLRKMGKSIEEVAAAVAEFDAVCGVEDVRAGDLFTDCDGDLCIMHGPGLRSEVRLRAPAFYEDGWRPGEETRADYVFGIVYSMLYKGEWSLCRWSPKHSEAQLAAEWKRV